MTGAVPTFYMANCMQEDWYSKTYVDGWDRCESTFCYRMGSELQNIRYHVIERAQERFSSLQFEIDLQSTNNSELQDELDEALDQYDQLESQSSR